jgi:hypothetical protein
MNQYNWNCFLLSSFHRFISTPYQGYFSVSNWTLAKKKKALTVKKSNSHSWIIMVVFLSISENTRVIITHQLSMSVYWWRGVLESKCIQLPYNYFKCLTNDSLAQLDHYIMRLIKVSLFDIHWHIEQSTKKALFF